MEQGTSRDADISLAGQEALYVLWNPKVRYLVHKSPSLVSILSQIIPVHSLPSYS
jgi:hypothetical protein